MGSRATNAQRLILLTVYIIFQSLSTEEMNNITSFFQPFLAVLNRFFRFIFFWKKVTPFLSAYKHKTSFGDDTPFFFRYFFLTREIELHCSYHYTLIPYGQFTTPIDSGPPFSIKIIKGRFRVNSMILSSGMAAPA